MTHIRELFPGQKLNHIQKNRLPQKIQDGKTERQNTEQEPRVPEPHPGLDLNVTRDDSYRRNNLPSRVSCRQYDERFLDSQMVCPLATARSNRRGGFTP